MRIGTQSIHLGMGRNVEKLQFRGWGVEKKIYGTQPPLIQISQLRGALDLWVGSALGPRVPPASSPLGSSSRPL